MRKFITDRGIEEMPTLGGLDAAERGQALEDAERVYAYLRRSEAQRRAFVPEDAVREWGERNGIGPTRMNVALGVLADTGRVVAAGPPPEAEEEPPAAARGADPAEQVEVRRTTLAPPGPGPAEAGIPPESDQATVVRDDSDQERDDDGGER